MFFSSKDFADRGVEGRATGFVVGELVPTGTAGTEQEDVTLSGETGRLANRFLKGAAGMTTAGADLRSRMADPIDSGQLAGAIRDG